MSVADLRQQQRRDCEVALAEQLIRLHEQPGALGDSFHLAAFHHRPESSAIAFLHTGASPNESCLAIAQASGLGLVGGALAGQCTLEWAQRSPGVDLTGLNRFYLANPPDDAALLGAALLRLRTDSLEWTGSFAGLPAPILVDDSGLVELLMGTGPFLGLTETSFPTVRGLLHPGKRLYLLAGSATGNLLQSLCDQLPRTVELSLTEVVHKLGAELAATLETGFGMMLVGVERKGD